MVQETGVAGLAGGFCLFVLVESSLPEVMFHSFSARPVVMAILRLMSRVHLPALLTFWRGLPVCCRGIGPFVLCECFPP